MPERGARPLSVLGIYPWNRFWSMGEFKGAPSFFLAPQALLKAGHSVHISMPKGGDIALTPEAGAGCEAAGAGATASDGESPPPAGSAETYHGMKLHRYGFAIDFMPMEGHPLFIHLTRPFRYVYYLMLAIVAGLRAARACRPDVVVGYGAWAAPVAFFVSRSLGLPNVTRLFGQSLSLGFESGWKSKMRLCLNYPEVMAFLSPCSCLIVHNDGSGGDKVAARLGVPAERIKFWRNGVDRDLFRPPENRSEMKSALGIKPEEPLILSVGRLDAEKHHERFVQALPEVLKSFPGAHAYIIGDGPERGSLETEALRLGVSASLKMPGAIPPKELASHYRACDVFLSLSDRTNASNPTMEAMCCGAPVVALDAGQTSSTLGVGDGALIVETDALPVLGDVLVDLLNDETKRSALADGAVAFAAEHVPSIEGRSEMEADAVAAAVVLR